MAIYFSKESFTIKNSKVLLFRNVSYSSGKFTWVIRNYTIGDVIARFKFMSGYNVLHPMDGMHLDYLLKTQLKKIIYIQKSGLKKI